MTPDLARTTYQEIEASNANGLQLVVMLYDGAIRFLNTAAEAIRVKDVRAKNVAIDKSLAILGELQSTLRMDEGGDIALQLDRLYTYMTSRILDGSATLEAGPIEEVIKLLTTLNGAWQQIATQKAVQPAPASNVSGSEDQPRISSLELFG